MKAKKIPLVLPLLFAAVIGVASWWFLRSSPVDSEKIVATPIQTKAVTPKPVASISSIALPTAPAVIAKTEPARSLATSNESSPDHADPHLDLKTAIPDLARAIRAGEGIYDYISPDEIAKLGPEVVQQQKEKKATEVASNDLGAMRSNETEAESYEALESQTPTFNAAGDAATYQFIPPTLDEYANGTYSGTGSQYEMIFIKIDGKWYLKIFGD